MRWFQWAWKDFPSSIISNFWNHTNLCSGAMSGAAGNHEDGLGEDIQNIVVQFVPAGSQMDVDLIFSSSRGDVGAAKS